MFGVYVLKGIKNNEQETRKWLIQMIDSKIEDCLLKWYPKVGDLKNYNNDVFFTHYHEVHQIFSFFNELFRFQSDRQYRDIPSLGNPKLIPNFLKI